MGIVQEKFQVDFEQPSQSHEWVPNERARRAKSYRDKLNRLPPGTHIEDQDLADIPAFPRTLDGRTDRTNYSTAAAMVQGFTRLPMSPVEDAYTAEHTDVFYGEKTVDGETGFCERGNTLDRL